MPLPPHEEGPGPLIAAGLLTLIIVMSSLLIPWRRLPSSAVALPPLAYFVVIALLRDAEGGAVSGYGLLVLLPVFWLALYGTRTQLSVALVMMVVMFALPIILFGEPRYPSSEWRRALMWAGLGPLIGFTVQQLVNEREQLVERLKQVARTDALTGIANRRAWDEELPRELARAQRSGDPLAVAILDLDHFKSFNDSLGHQAGDQLLKEAAAAWRDLIRAPDFIARYGGEEFAVLLPRCPAGATRAIVERLRSSTPSDQTTSAGAACWDGSESPDELVGRADSALYEAKRAGRDRSVVADVEEIILDRRGP